MFGEYKQQRKYGALVYSANIMFEHIFISFDHALHVKTAIFCFFISSFMYVSISIFQYKTHFDAEKNKHVWGIVNDIGHLMCLSMLRHDE